MIHTCHIQVSFITNTSQILDHLYTIQQYTTPSTVFPVLMFLGTTGTRTLLLDSDPMEPVRIHAHESVVDSLCRKWQRRRELVTGVRVMYCGVVPDCGPQQYLCKKECVSGQYEAVLEHCIKVIMGIFSYFSSMSQIAPLTRAILYWYSENYLQDVLVTTRPKRSTKCSIPRCHSNRVSPGGAAAEHPCQDDSLVVRIVVHDVVTLSKRKEREGRIYTQNT